MFEIKNLNVSYGQNSVYKNFNLTLKEGQTACVLGESGCGKTTLLNAVAGLIPYTGTITPAKISYVFQTPRLVPNLTVLGNLTLIGADKTAAEGMLERAGLIDKKNAYPHTLSGGEAQRVALCRALLFPADLMLLDEPFSSLDLKNKISVMDTFKCLNGGTALFVTHDIDEALYLSDRIVVIKNGQISLDIQNVKTEILGENSPTRQVLINNLIE